MPQNSDQNHHDTNEDLPSQKAKGRRGRSSAATFFGTAEAEAVAIVLLCVGGNTPRFTRIARPMQSPATTTASGFGFGGKILVDSIKQRVKGGIVE